MGSTLHYEDFAAGQQFESAGGYTIGKDNAIAFAREYDPQLQHTDEVGARQSVFGKLVVSGWHTAAVTMRLKTQTILAKVEGGLVGMGLEQVRWPRPTMPGDTLHIVVTILEKRLSNSSPGKGIIKYKVETLNQHNELMMEMVTAVLVPCRKAAH